MNFRPLLAATLELDDIEQIPYEDGFVLSPKLDGIRCLVLEGKVYSRRMKPIPNQYVQELFSHLTYFDGELIVGDPTDPHCYNITQSGVMSRSGTPDVKLWAFDHVANPHAPFLHRYNALCGNPQNRVELVPHYKISSSKEFFELENLIIGEGYEGVCARRSDAPYFHNRRAKENRSTLSEGILLKFKRFRDDEAIITGFMEGCSNQNLQEANYCGLMKRNHRKDNLEPNGMVGTIKGIFDGQTIDIAPGFMDHATRIKVWNNQEKYLGLVCKFRHFPIGTKDKPRHPRFVGFRSKIDL